MNSCVCSCPDKIKLFHSAVGRFVFGLLGINLMMSADSKV